MLARLLPVAGRSPAKTDIEGALRDHHDEIGPSLDEPTLADFLRQAGYETGLVGK